MGAGGEEEEVKYKIRKDGYDKPRDGYVRYTVYLEAHLLQKFKEVAANEGKSMIEAIKEAVENWVGDT
jgi:hypothetical protein